MAHDAELVPCPGCGWVNLDLIARHRAVRELPLSHKEAMGGFAGLLTVTLGCILLESPTAGLQHWLGILLLIAGAAISAAVIWCAWRLRLARRQVNPNLLFPQQTPLPPGTPPALLEHRDAVTGKSHLTPAPRPRAPLKDEDEWVHLRRGQIAWPDACAQCLGPAETVYSVPLTISMLGEHPPPLCTACAALLHRRWKRIAALCVISSFVIGFTPFVSVFAREPEVVIVAALPLGALLAVIALALVPSQLTAPCRLDLIDIDRGILRCQGRDRRFTNLLRASTAQAETITMPTAEVPRAGDHRAPRSDHH